MIGYYVHHQGRGHLQRARALAAELTAGLDVEVAGVSSLPRPDDWPGPWIELARDDAGGAPVDPTAGGALHWVPIGDRGLGDRMHAVSQFLAERRPRLMICDVSVEVALLSRLHGVPVATVVLPGERGDAAHVLGRRVSDLLVAFWPREASRMVTGLGADDAARLRCVGALARDAVPVAAAAKPLRRRSVVVLGGAGGGGLSSSDLTRARAQTPEWEWRVLGGPAGTWVDDPRPALLAADVVVTHAGEGAVAAVAAARRPAVVFAQERPHGEQFATARVLAHGGWPAVVSGDPAAADWPRLLTTAAGLPGDGWASWCDGGAAARFSALVAGFLEGERWAS